MSTQKQILEERIQRLTVEKAKFLESINPSKFKSEFITCQNCKGKVPKQYFRGFKCPICGFNYELSVTNKSRLESFDDRLKKARKELADLNKKAVVKDLKKQQKMRFNTSTQKQIKSFERQSSFLISLREVKEQLDYILEEQDTGDFVEIIGKMGGDTITYRIYKSDGRIYER